MMLKAIAVDYDGTIAHEGQIDPDVREAILEARKSGLLVVIVTGRILSDLRRVAGDLRFVDGVVAENGSVVWLACGHRRVLGPPPFTELLSELSSRGLEFVAGRCLVDMDARHAAVVQEIIRNLNLPLIISFNRSRMMILPQSISKSTGLRVILDMLATSPHNTLGIGDAENDYELIKGCEYGVAVDWAPDFLKENANYVLPGNSLKAVAKFIREMSANPNFPVSFPRHRHLVLESKVGHKSFELAIRGRNVLIAGDSKSGKSWIAGLLCEQLIMLGYTVIIIDPEGDYSSLTRLPNTLLLGPRRTLPDVAELPLFLRQGLSIILNLSHFTHHEKVAYIQQLLPIIKRFRRMRGYPHSLLLDECHYFLEENDGEAAFAPSLGSNILVTYKPSLLTNTILGSLEAIVATRTVEQEELDTILEVSGSDDTDGWRDLLKNLKTSEAALLPPTIEAAGEPRKFEIVSRLTQHVRHHTKYYNQQLQSEQHFIYTKDGSPVGVSATNLHELAQSVGQVETDVLHSHIQRHDFSKWIRGAFNDSELVKKVQYLESQYIRNKDDTSFSEGLAGMVDQSYKNFQEGS